MTITSLKNNLESTKAVQYVNATTFSIRQRGNRERQCMYAWSESQYW